MLLRPALRGFDHLLYPDTPGHRPARAGGNRFSQNDVLVGERAPAPGALRVRRTGAELGASLGFPDVVLGVMLVPHIRQNERRAESFRDALKYLDA